MALSQSAKGECAMDEPITDRVPDTPSEITCETCGTIDLPAIADGTWPHFKKLSCRSCGAFSRWLSKYTPEEREERHQHFRQEAIHAKPPTDKQLALLRSKGVSPLPTDRAVASEMIDRLVRTRGLEGGTVDV